MKQKKSERPREPSRLQSDLLPRILELVRRDGLGRGARLTELGLAARLRVSRTPVRAALSHLAARGVLERATSRGYVLAKAADEMPGAEPSLQTEVDPLFVAIARDRLDAALPDDVSEADLMRRYGVTRPTLQRVLTKLAEVGLVERKPGHGWHFLASVRDLEARAESYRFRLLIEPACVLEPSFKLDPDWAAEMRRRHEEMRQATWRQGSSVALFEMNAAFHEGLAAASGNRYLLMAVQQQNRLRRFSNYAWRLGAERAAESCREHLEILARLEAHEHELAAALMRRHLTIASRLTRPWIDAPTDRHQDVFVDDKEHRAAGRHDASSAE